jgi:site-specific recombinase XerD
VIRYLAEDEQRRLVNACSADFREIVRAALLTGCRYGELIALRAADYNADAGTITVYESKAGKARHVVLTDEGCALFNVLTAGRKGDTRIFLRSDGKPWGASHQQRPLAEACTRARISPAVSFHILRHSHGSTLAMRGVPMGVIAAQLGHSDTRMTEKHYAHLAPSYVADTIRANFPNLGLAKDVAVTALPNKNFCVRIGRSMVYDELQARHRLARTAWAVFTYTFASCGSRPRLADCKALSTLTITSPIST